LNTIQLAKTFGSQLTLFSFRHQSQRITRQVPLHRS